MKIIHNLNCKDVNSDLKFEKLYNNPKYDIREKYICCFILGGIGDTFGYMNGLVEFNFGEKKFSPTMSLRIFYYLLENGGISGIDMEGKIVSDDTIFHMATARGLLKSDIYEGTIKEYITEIDEPGIEKRAIGLTMKDSLEKIRDGMDWKTLPYNENGGGNGAVMRMMCVGLAYHSKDQLDKLIEVSITLSKMTHNNPIGYLGGLVSAYVTSLAIQKVNIYHWLDHIIGLLSNNKIDEFIKGKVSTNEYNKYLNEKTRYTDRWKIYREILYSHKISGSNVTVRKIDYVLSHRMEFYKKKINILDEDPNVLPGSDGLDCPIIAFDCLIDAKDNWELLMYFAMLNSGDSDSIGSVAAAWYGAYYGRPKNLLINQWKDLEYSDELYELGEKMYNKFYKK